MLNTLFNPKLEVNIGVVGKYVDLKESYKSLHEALVHSGISNNAKVNVIYIDAEPLNPKNVKEALNGVDGILVPGGFGERGAEGKIAAIQYARESEVPFFGICLGMQMAAVEFARNVCGFKDAASHEFTQVKKGRRNLVIDFMDEQKDIKNKGGTMRLGAYPCHLKKGSRAFEIYDEKLIYERHRHRYEFNNKYRPIFEKNGMNLSGICKDRDLVEIIEITEHPWFIGVQFHPEFKSKPLMPHPLFRSFIEHSLLSREKNVARADDRPKKKKTKVASRKAKTRQTKKKNPSARSVN
ncbi:MAG: CTP synthase [Bdellovibrionales bacterium]